jgi:glutamate carboxypeptidase
VTARPPAGATPPRVMGDAESLVADLLALSAHDAPSSDPAGSADAVEWLAARLERVGVSVARHRTSTGIVLEGRLGPPVGKSPVLILGHYDTVWPVGTAGARPARVEDGLVHGPGVFDMRGGIISALAALELAAPLERPVQILLTPDEETGSTGSRELTQRAARDAALVLVPEPPLPGGALKTSRSGYATYVLRVAGRAAHAGLEPEAGASAIDELTDRLPEVRALARPDRGTTINVGVIGGGSAPNVVADSAWAEIDVRAATVLEQERVDAALAALRAERAGTSVLAETRVMAPPMERTPVIAAAFARTSEIAASLGLELAEGHAGGASDGNFVAPLGVPVIDGVGPEGAGAHALGERVTIGSLVERARLIARLVEEW